MEPKRIVTHTDFDGVVCAVLLKEVFSINTITFTEPWLIQNGSFSAEPGDVFADLPFPQEGCAHWFDHHEPATPIPEVTTYHLDVTEPSCAGYIYRLFENTVDLTKYTTLVVDADKIDSANYTREDLENYSPAEKLSRCLARSRENHEFLSLIVDLLTTMTCEEVLEHPQVAKKWEEQEREQSTAWKKSSPYIRTTEPLFHLDLSDSDEEIHGFDRYEPFLKYPKCTFTVRIRRKHAKDPSALIISVGKNIFVGQSNIHIGRLLQKFGGGGHKNVGGCPATPENKEKVISSILHALENAKIH
jgi:hypothetical protein